jgi:hypothetical protein
MKKWHLIGRAVEPDPSRSEGVQEFYLASEVDVERAELVKTQDALVAQVNERAVRIAELAKALRWIVEKEAKAHVAFDKLYFTQHICDGEFEPIDPPEDVARVINSLMESAQ